MAPQDFPIVHFGQMTRLARALGQLSAQILEHAYSSESFGSWQITLRYKGKVAEVSFDRRDGVLEIRRSSDRKAPYTFGTAENIGAGGPIGEVDDTMIEKVCAATRP
jgi:hypothetical protein